MGLRPGLCSSYPEPSGRFAHPATFCQPLPTPISHYQPRARQYTKHVLFWRIGSGLPPTLGVILRSNSVSFIHLTSDDFPTRELILLST